jgi:hypothetical protein
MIAPGKYRTNGPGEGSYGGYWARLKRLDGSLDAIIANGSVDGPITLTINKTDVAVQFSGNDTSSGPGSGNPTVKCPVADASPTGRNRWQLPRISDGHGGMPVATTGAASPLRLR